MIKSLACVSAIGLMLALSPAMAQGKGGFTETVPAKGGFTGPSSESTTATVAQAKDMADDQKVVLQGRIIQHLGGDKYLFEDGTGSITVDIDHDEWAGQTVSPTDKVEIRGEVDKGKRSVKIDVDWLRKL